MEAIIKDCLFRDGVKRTQLVAQCGLERQCSHVARTSVLRLSGRSRRCRECRRWERGGSLRLCLRHNGSGTGGALNVLSNGAAQVRSCVFTRNTASYGGAIYAGGDLTIDATTIVQNNAYDGGLVLELNCHSDAQNDCPQ